MRKQFNEELNPDFEDQSFDAPKDLMTIKELCLKHGFDYDYLYKRAIQSREINVYFRGSWKLSESEVLAFSRKIAEQKLSKIVSGKREAQ